MYVSGIYPVLLDYLLDSDLLDCLLDYRSSLCYVCVCMNDTRQNRADMHCDMYDE
jgi:hypothetical protein